MHKKLKRGGLTFCFTLQFKLRTEFSTEQASIEGLSTGESNTYLYIIWYITDTFKWLILIIKATKTKNLENKNKNKY